MSFSKKVQHHICPYTVFYFFSEAVNKKYRIIAESNIYNEIYTRSIDWINYTSFYERILPSELLLLKPKSDEAITFKDLFVLESKDANFTNTSGYKYFTNFRDSLPFNKKGGVSNDVYHNIATYIRSNGFKTFYEIKEKLLSVLDSCFGTDKSIIANEWFISLVDYLINDESSDYSLSYECHNTNGRLYDESVDLYSYIINIQNSISKNQSEFSSRTLSDICNVISLLIIASLFPVDMKTKERNITPNIDILLRKAIPSLENKATISVLGFEVPNPKLFRFEEYECAWEYMTYSSQEKRELLISGLGGDGKTTLATWLYKRFKENSNNKYGSILWIDYQKSLDNSFLNCIDMVVAAEATTSTNDNEKLNLILSTLKKPKNRRTLIIIDNYKNDNDSMNENSIISLSDLLSLDYPLLDIIITTRSKTEKPLERFFKNTSKKDFSDSSFVIDLQRISSDCAIRLFKAYYDQTIDKNDEIIVSQLVSKASNHVLTIQLLALCAKESLKTLKQFACELSDFQFPKDVVITNHNNNYENAAAQLKKLYLISNLSIEEQKTIWSFALLPNNLSFTPREVNYYFFDECSKYAKKLAFEKGWLSYSPDDGFRIHDIVKMVVKLNILPNSFKPTNENANRTDLFWLSHHCCKNGFAPYDDLFINLRRKVNSYTSVEELPFLSPLNIKENNSITVTKDDIFKHFSIINACIDYLKLSNFEMLQLLYYFLDDIYLFERPSSHRIGYYAESFVSAFSVVLDSIHLTKFTDLAEYLYANDSFWGVYFTNTLEYRLTVSIYLSSMLRIAADWFCFKANIPKSLEYYDYSISISQDAISNPLSEIFHQKAFVFKSMFKSIIKSAYLNVINEPEKLKESLEILFSSIDLLSDFNITSDSNNELLPLCYSTLGTLLSLIGQQTLATNYWKESILSIKNLIDSDYYFSVSNGKLEVPYIVFMNSYEYLKSTDTELYIFLSTFLLNSLKHFDSIIPDEPTTLTDVLFDIDLSMYALCKTCMLRLEYKDGINTDFENVIELLRKCSQYESSFNNDILTISKYKQNKQLLHAYYHYAPQKAQRFFTDTN